MFPACLEKLIPELAEVRIIDIYGLTFSPKKSEMEMTIAHDIVSATEFLPEPKSMTSHYLFDSATDIDSLKNFNTCHC